MHINTFYANRVPHFMVPLIHSSLAIWGMTMITAYGENTLQEVNKDSAWTKWFSSLCCTTSKADDELQMSGKKSSRFLPFFLFQNNVTGIVPLLTRNPPAGEHKRVLLWVVKIHKSSLKCTKTQIQPPNAIASWQDMQPMRRERSLAKEVSQEAAIWKRKREYHLAGALLPLPKHFCISLSPSCFGFGLPARGFGIDSPRYLVPIRDPIVTCIHKFLKYDTTSSEAIYLYSDISFTIIKYNRSGKILWEGGKQIVWKHNCQIVNIYSHKMQINCLYACAIIFAVIITFGDHRLKI